MVPACRAVDAGLLSQTRAKPRVYCVDKGSLYDILKKNAGLHLFVKPIKWTDLHLAFLGIGFRNLSPVTDPSPKVDPSKATINLPARVQALINALDDLLETKSKESRVHSIRTVIPTLYPGRMSFLNITELHQHFDGRAYRDAFKGRSYRDTCPVQAAWETTPARSSSITPCESMPTRTQGSVDVPTVANIGGHIASNQPILSYFDLKSIAAMRLDMYRVGRCNPSVRRLKKLSYRKIVPPKTKEDPFIAAVILALAQRPFYREHMPPADKSLFSPPVSSSLKEPEFHDVTVHILTVGYKETSPPCFIAYKGLVTKELLYKFHKPTKNPRAAGDQTLAGAMEGERDMQIEYTEVPVWPIRGLKERLGKALGKQTVGPFDADNIEKWEQIADPNLKKEYPNDAE